MSFKEAFDLAERAVVALETIAKNSSGKPTDTSGLEAVTKSSSTKKPTLTETVKEIREAAGVTAAEAKKALKAADGDVGMAIAELLKDTPAEEPEADADKSERSGSDNGKVDTAETGESTKDADEVKPPSKEEVAAAQVYKKELLDIARGNNDYVPRIKAVLAKFDATAETVPADKREEVKAAVIAEFKSETDKNI